MNACRRLGIFCGLASAALLTLSADLFAVDVACPGADLPVVVPPQSPAAVVTAGRELAEYLGKVTGRPIAVVDAPPATGGAVYLGDSAFARSKGIDCGKLAPEEWLLREVDGNLVIGGGSPRGTLYGVYHFLEDEVGVLWLTPADEYVPRRERVSFAGERRGKPAFRYREIYFVAGTGAEAFLARNRMCSRLPQYGGTMVNGGARGNHTMYCNLGGPDEIRKLFAVHPDYFPLVDGKRYLDAERADRSAQSQLCLTSPGLRKLWVERLRGYVRKERAVAKEKGLTPPINYMIDQNDCADGFCRCPSCAAIIEREGSVAGLLLDFVNHVADELKDEAPEAIFRMLAYCSTEKPPKFLKARDNVGVRLCDTTSNVLKPWTDPENAPHYDNLVAWGKCCKNVAMWDYQITFGSPSSRDYPTSTTRTIATDMKTLFDNSGDGVFFEHENPVGANLRDLKVWLECKYAENPNLDYGTMLKKFTDAYYGAAGSAVRAYVRLLEKVSAGARITFYPVVRHYDFLDEKAIALAYKVFDRGFAAVKGDETLTRRLEYARLSLDRLAVFRGDKSREQDYLATFRRERERRGITDKSENPEQFVRVAAHYRVPVPPEFAAVPADRLFLFNANNGDSTFLGGRMTSVEDFSSAVCECARLRTEFLPEKAKAEAVWPYRGRIVGVFPSGDASFTMTGEPPHDRMPYTWYKLAEGVKLGKDSVVELFSGYRYPLAGVVRDNTELGSRYTVWISFRKGGIWHFVDRLAVVKESPVGAD